MDPQQRLPSPPAVPHQPVYNHPPQAPEFIPGRAPPTLFPPPPPPPHPPPPFPALGRFQLLPLLPRRSFFFISALSFGDNGRFFEVILFPCHSPPFVPFEFSRFFLFFSLSFFASLLFLFGGVWKKKTLATRFEFNLSLLMSESPFPHHFFSLS